MKILCLVAQGRQNKFPVIFLFSEVIITEEKNIKRLKKSYERLVSVTQKKIAEMTKDTDIKILKDAFSAVKEGVNIGQLFTDDGGNYIQIIFEGETEEFSG